MRRALALAVSLDAPLGPNPRVGAVLLGPDGAVLAEGYHRGAGTPHAEVVALSAAREAGLDPSGSTMVVTLEPCNHHGRTPPCSVALRQAGVARVVFALADPTPTAAGGAAVLAAAGLDVEGGVLAERARDTNQAWLRMVAAGRPWVTWKYAATLDGRVAAPDGTSRWITSPAARADVHARRARADVVLVGTGTVRADDPSLTVRDPAGVALAAQPLRAVMGRSPVPAGARVLDGSAPTVLLDTRDPDEALSRLAARGVADVLLEGGPTLAAAFVRAGLVDEVLAYLAPTLLGAGPAALADVGVATMTAALRLSIDQVSRVGPDLRVRAVFVHVAQPAEGAQ